MADPRWKKVKFSSEEKALETIQPNLKKNTQEHSGLYHTAIIINISLSPVKRAAHITVPPNIVKLRFVILIYIFYKRMISDITASTFLFRCTGCIFQGQTGL